jgi:acetoacetyl-CoA reductase
VFKEHTKAAHEVMGMLQEQGSRVVLIQADVAAPDAPAQIVEAALGQFGRIDCLINNAGITRDASLQKLSLEATEEVLDVNLVGAMRLAQAVLPSMIENRFGRIVNIASFVGQKGNFGQTNYAASKAGLIGWTKASALECARYGITVNALCPGFIMTDMVMSLSEEIRERITRQIPLGRLGQPEEVADAVVFLLRSDYMTGAQLNINGGIYM